MKLQPHQQRVAEEKVDLDIKINKLDIFIHGPIYPTLEQTERLRLTRQFVYMKEYSNILTERITAFRSQE